jgi:isopenicillin N synthase-like dioxygenase
MTFNASLESTDRLQCVALHVGLQTHNCSLLPTSPTLDRLLTHLFAQVLDLPPTYFGNMFKTLGATCQLLHYSPQPSTSPTFGASAHTDTECFTIRYQCTQPALRLLNADGEWLSAPPIPGTLVASIGDMRSC